MTDCKLKQEIKQLLKDVTFQYQEGILDLDLSTEKMKEIVDREAIRRMMEAKDTFFDVRIRTREKHGQ